MRWLLVLLIIAGAVWYFASRQGGSSPTGRPAAAIPGPGGTTLRQAPPNFDAEIHRAAKDARVQITRLQLEPGGANVEVTWTGNVAAQSGDFLTLCLNRGILRSFDEDGPAKVEMVNGALTYTGSYHIRF